MKALLAPLLALVLAGSVLAQEAAPPSGQTATEQRSEVGVAARGWLELQRSGRAAGSAHPIPGEIATLNWRRYVESHKTTIPETFGTQAGGAGSRK